MLPLPSSKHKVYVVRVEIGRERVEVIHLAYRLD